jgi:hypothetical protein
MEIPHLETRWDYRLRRESCLVNLYPHPTTLSKVSSHGDPSHRDKVGLQAEERELPRSVDAQTGLTNQESSLVEYVV